MSSNLRNCPMQTEGISFLLTLNCELGTVNPSSDTSKPRVFCAEASYDVSLQQLVEEVFATFPRNWQGKNVLVKPNILASHPPESAVTTHPALVRSVVNVLKDLGAQVIVGDNPGVGGYGQSEKSAAECGLFEASQGCFLNLGQNPVQHKVRSRYFQSVAISREVLEVDEVVNLPKLKTHSLTVLTGAIKNTFGYIVGGDKMRVHASCPTPMQFAEALVDVYSLRPPTLNIMDAVVAMQGNGPANGSPIRLGKILASDNAVSLDAIAVYFLGQRIKRVPHLEIAGKRGLGETDPSRITFPDDLTPVKGFCFPKTFVPGLTGFILNRYLSKWINCLPEVIPERCKSCGLCAEHCPSGAMQMTGKGPVLQTEECIHCYCCQEMCPEDAIRLSGRLFNFLKRD